MCTPWGAARPGWMYYSFRAPPMHYARGHLPKLVSTPAAVPGGTRNFLIPPGCSLFRIDCLRILIELLVAPFAPMAGRRACHAQLCGKPPELAARQALVDSWIEYSTTEIDIPLLAWVYPYGGITPYDKKVRAPAVLQAMSQT